MIKKSFICFLGFNIMLLSGCGIVQHVPLTNNNYNSIKTVYINPEIKKPKMMYEFASGSELGFAFGAIGGAISGEINANSAIATQQYAEKNQIDIRKIVYQQWKNQIIEKTKFKLSNQPADAVLTTNIALYGISIPHGFSSDYVPVLNLNAKLVRKNQIIWQDSEQVLPLTSGMPRYKMDQIINDPKILYKMWDKASEKIINEMLNDMKK